jgi:hypothetical protein
MANKNKKNNQQKQGQSKQVPASVDNTTTKYVDLLDEDKPIAGQKFVCISFVSPENILKRKEHYYFEKFLRYFDFQKSMSKYQQFLHFVSYKYNIDFNKVSEDYKEFIESEKDNLLNNTTIEDEYKVFLDNNEDALDKEFYENNNFQTSVRGIKVRGSFASLEEAELRCKLLREQDPNHDIYVGPVGVWVPWEPDAFKTGRVEYMEKKLNQLMSEKQKNEQKAKEEFEQRVKEAKQKAIAENKKLARKTGNKLTQNIDKQGNLIGIQGMNTTETNIRSQLNSDNQIMESADLKKELFEGENIILKSKSNTTNS